MRRIGSSRAFRLVGGPILLPRRFTPMLEWTRVIEEARVAKPGLRGSDSPYIVVAGRLDR